MKIIIAGIILGLTMMLGLYYISRPNPAPEVTFNLTQGDKIELAKLKGKPVLINFWATTCSICREEMPELYRLHKEFNHQGLEIIGVAMYYDPPNEVMKFLNNNNIPYPIALDINKTLSKAFRNISITPTNVLISPDGLIIEKITGSLPFESIREKIQTMLLENNAS